VATRLHGWSLFLSGYSYDIVYRNTLKHGNEDALPRLPLPDSATTDPGTNVKVLQVISENPLTSKQVRFSTARDKVFSQVIRFVNQGWPSKSSQLPDDLKPYSPHQHDFLIEQGILMWGLRVVVPASLQTSVLNQLHETHPGIVRMNSMTRQYVWWPGIDGDIESSVKSCVNCAQSRDNPSVAPLHPWSFPKKPWQRLHVDLAGPFLNNMWLIVVDAYSKWPEVFQLGKDTTSAKVIQCVRETFSRFGLPNTIVSDNGPQFVSHEFEKFCRDNGVRHSTSSAYHPRSNGEAERFVRTFKNGMRASEKSDLPKSLANFLSTYRITAHGTTGSAPSEMLMKRKVKTLLDLLRPNPDSHVRASQEKQKKNFDGRIPVREFRANQNVWVQTFSKNSPKWSLGTVIKPVGPVSYEVRVDGRVMKRHVDHMLCGEASFTTPSEPEMDSPPTSTSPVHPPASPSPVKSEPITPYQTPVSSPAMKSTPGQPSPTTEEPERRVSNRSRRPPVRLNMSLF